MREACGGGSERAMRGVRRGVAPSQIPLGVMSDRQKKISGDAEKTKPDWTGLDWTGLDWTGLDWTVHVDGLST